MSAAVNGHLPCVETLLGSRAQVDATNVRPRSSAAAHAASLPLRFRPPHSLHARRARQNVGYTALHWSAINDHPDVVRRLLASGANRTTRDKGGKSALDYAREKGYTAVVALLEAPAVWDAASDGDNDELRKLIADGGDVNWKNPYVRSPHLTLAAARGTSPRRLSPTSPFSCDALIWHTSDALIWPCNPSDADGGMPRPSSRLVCHVGARSGMRTLRSWPPSRMVRLPR